MLVFKEAFGGYPRLQVQKGYNDTYLPQVYLIPFWAVLTIHDSDYPKQNRSLENTRYVLTQKNTRKKPSHMKLCKLCIQAQREQDVWS